MDASPAPLLTMRDITKSFAGVRALRGVDFDLQPGEVHAVLGENGAGKSTLMKTLAGVYRPDAGTITVRGRPVALQNPQHAQALGISIVYQELNLFGELSVAENIFPARQPTRSALQWVDRRAAEAAAARYLALLAPAIDPTQPVRTLGIAQQQVVEIAKALSADAQILVLDEPTSSLTSYETARLFAVIRQLQARGLGIVYISHRLDEILALADRVTVLRDGERVATVATNTVTGDDLVRLMIGRRLERLYGSGGTPGTRELLQVEHLTAPGHFRDVSFTLHAGEILGFAGLIGAGRTAVGQAIFGVLRVASGRITLAGQLVAPRSPRHAQRQGIAYLTENRRSDGLFLSMSLRANVSVSHLSRYARLGFLSARRERAGVAAQVQQLRVRAASVEQPIAELSGGNQQKALLARCLAIQPQVLIADEPTRGVDVGAKAEIYALLHELAVQGVGIMLISSELPEVLGMSHRVVAMREGRVVGMLDRTAASEEAIMALCTGQAPAQEHKL